MRLLPLATAALDAAGAQYSVRESASLEHARELAAAGAQRGDTVVAVGGDGLAGTLAGVVAAAGGTYGIIPAGRGNDMARVLGLPAGTANATGVLTGGRTRQVDLIGVSAAGRAESVVAGSVYAGIPSVAGEIANAMRWLKGPAVYPVAALRALASWKPAMFRVEIGGGGSQPVVHDFPGYAVVVANFAYFGAGMMVAPTARLDDGMLDVILMRHGAKLAFVRVLMKIKDGSHVSLPLISLERGAEVTLTADRQMSPGADGEPIFPAPLAGGAALRVRALPSVLTVLAPVAGP